MNGKGHLFIARGDLTRIACDSWLLPTDSFGFVEKPWGDAVPDLGTRLENHGVGGGGSFKQGCLEIPETASGNQGPAWVTDVAGDGQQGIASALLGVAAFIRGASSVATKRPGGRPLLAVPLVGTGEGGWGDDKGSLLLALIPAILDQLEGPESPDVALIVDSEEKLAACQLARDRAFESRGGSPWDEISPAMRHSASVVAGRVLAGKLVLFLGAGLGRSAGLPGWNELLDNLAEELGMENHLDAVNPLDRAWLLERKLSKKAGGTQHGSLGDLVASQLSGPRAPSITHQLIASLPIDEVVTTNYDELFEVAARCAGRPATLVTDSEPVQGRWLAKLHGSVTKPDEIVLSRSDYLDYSSKRAALSGIVQAMLLTRHMLFVGFSMTDDNFLKIVHDVKNAMGTGRKGETAIGTTLTVNPPSYMEDLWNGIVDICTVEPPELSFRGIDIYLDLLLAKTTPPASYLFDSSFDALLGDGDRLVRDELEDTARRLDEVQDADSPSAARYRQFLREFGHT